ncbi:hypothetical protein I547_5741 [Mycobacterium kansasii 824]|nr:hypothetical protein I547_5741 [Mycobacterium kansasii 824]
MTSPRISAASDNNSPQDRATRIINCRFSDPPAMQRRRPVTGPRAAAGAGPAETRVPPEIHG